MTARYHVCRKIMPTEMPDIITSHLSLLSLYSLKEYKRNDIKQ